MKLTLLSFSFFIFFNKINIFFLHNLFIIFFHNLLVYFCINKIIFFIMKKSELMSMSLLCLCGRCNISKKLFIFIFF